MKKSCQPLFLLLAALLLSACATTPKFDTTAIDVSITPPRAVVEGEALRGAQVLWGGMIIAASNLKDVTQFEILAYPLTASQKPDIDKAPLGRFLAQQAGYLETRDYQQGRLMTVSGTLQERHVGRIGESEYTYPVVSVDQHYLWPQAGVDTNTRFHFGIGVMFRN